MTYSQTFTLLYYYFISTKFGYPEEENESKYFTKQFDSLGINPRIINYNSSSTIFHSSFSRWREINSPK